jgi:hypothetical protein
MSRRNIKLGCAILAATAAILIVVCIVWPVARFVASSNRHMTVRESTRFLIPGTSHAIEHSRIGINPIVAEYKRDVTFFTDGTRGNTTALSIDTCGGYPINCYLVATDDRTFLRLDDAVSEHLLDLDEQKTYVVTHYKNDAYVGELVSDSMSTGRSMVDDDPSTLKVTVGGKEATPRNGLTRGAVGVYIGCLTGGLDNLRFVTASDSPERPVDHLFDR